MSDVERILGHVGPGLIEFDTEFREFLGFSALRPEARLLLFIRANGPVSVKEAMIDSKMSYRGFYTILNGLMEKKIIQLRPDARDKRVRRLFFYGRD
jgi:hypothetical protein